MNNLKRYIVAINACLGLALSELADLPSSLIGKIITPIFMVFLAILGVKLSEFFLSKELVENNSNK